MKYKISVRSPQKRTYMVKLRESLGYSSMRVCMAIFEKNGASNLLSKTDETFSEIIYNVGLHLIGTIFYSNKRF